jgi:hypothetical protein
MSTERNPSINDDDGEGGALDPPERKKLKLCEPDLKITVGHGVDGSDAVDYWYHASIMANHSVCIDTMLASGMKESNTYEVSFPDIAPAAWDSMMKFLDNPLAGRLMTVKDVMEVAPWYGQYDFPGGLVLCGHILAEYIHQAVEKEKKVPDDLDLFIDAIHLTDALHLVQDDAAVRWIQATMLGNHRTIFSRDHIAKLAPLIAKEDSLFAIVVSVFTRVVTKDGILHWSFPEQLVDKFALCNKNKMLRALVPRITLSGSGCKNVDGVYSSNSVPISAAPHETSDFRWQRPGRGRYGVTFQISVRDDIWVIFRAAYPFAAIEVPSEVPSEDDAENIDSLVGKILWKCPHSRNLVLPPTVGWVPVDEVIPRGQALRLKYNMS